MIAAIGALAEGTSLPALPVVLSNDGSGHVRHELLLAAFLLAHAQGLPCVALDGELVVPQPLATGPWYAGSMHGSAMLALLARAVERHPSEHDMQVTRFTVDMMRAAPMRPVTTPTVCHHAGRSSESIEA